MRAYTKGVNDARVTENLTWQAVNTVLGAVPSADIAGMIEWAKLDDQDGFDLAALLAAWPLAATLTLPQQRFLMRFVARQAGGVVVG